MDTADLLGYALLAGFFAFVVWYGLRTQRRAAVPLRRQNLDTVATLLGPRLQPADDPPAGAWHRVLKESHSAASLYDSRGVEVFSELVVQDHLGRFWHCKLRCDDRGGTDEPVLTPLAATTVSWTA